MFIPIFFIVEGFNWIRSLGFPFILKGFLVNKSLCSTVLHFFFFLPCVWVNRDEYYYYFHFNSAQQRGWNIFAACLLLVQPQQNGIRASGWVFVFLVRIKMGDSASGLVRLTASNYFIWNTRMEDILYYKDLFEPTELNGKKPDSRLMRIGRSWIEKLLDKLGVGRSVCLPSYSQRNIVFGRN